MIFPIAIFYTVIFVVASLIFLGIAWGIGRIAYDSTNRRWIQIFAVLFVLWLPFWDVIPGYFIFRHAFNELGGARIYKTAEVTGYLDADATDLPQIWPRLLSEPYQYVEMLRTHPSSVYQQQEEVPGYYEYRLASLADAVCSGPMAIHPNQADFRARLGERCILAIRRDEPISGYESKGSGWIRYIEWMSFPNVMIFERNITNRMTKEVMAESYQVRFRSWSGLFGFRIYQNEVDKPLHFDRREVLIPKAD